ncbi:MAG TPA: peptide ABC transporter substrate-binding protein [Anaerolineaceae bacterium]
MHSRKQIIPVTILVIASIILTSCRAATPAPGETPAAPTSPATAAPTLVKPTATATTVPTRTLVACLQSEPQTLYVYGGNSQSMWSVLEALYDGPFDTRGYSEQPVILKKVPNLTDGDAVLKPVAVKAGDQVVDASGNLVALQKGTTVLPSGCSGPDCAKAWDGTSELQMDQLSVSFKLLPGLKWSDGVPLTAADSVFSYTIAADPDTPVSRYLTDRTVSYKAADDQTVDWVGLPGFFEQRFGTFFWTPLPKHTLGSMSAKQLLADTNAGRKPLGWGPYVVQEWAAGDHITLIKNPNYFRAAEGLPKFDTLVFRFVGDTADSNLNALLSGECDVIDQNPQFLQILPDLIQREPENKLKIHLSQGPEWEHLDFGIRPASYDNGYNLAAGDRPDLFGDLRTRQAVAYCIDRATINTKDLYGRSTVPDSFLPADHPLHQKGLPAYAYNPDEGQKLLDEVGWKDTDKNPATPRVAVGVKNVPDGTPLSFTYLTTQAPLRQQVAQEVASSLEKCGIQAKLKFVNPGELFAPGPDGPVFGRKFDMVQFSWEATARPNCLLYSSAQIPNASNHWIGSNVAGYTSSDFDATCAAASAARPNDANFTAKNQAVQELFAKDLPVIPLFTQVNIAIARPDLCGFSMDSTARSIFWNLEAFDYGPGCK